MFGISERPQMIESRRSCAHGSYCKHAISYDVDGKFNAQLVVREQPYRLLSNLVACRMQNQQHLQRCCFYLAFTSDVESPKYGINLGTSSSSSSRTLKFFARPIQEHELCNRTAAAQ